jgi:Domain of unknown function (DUF6438)
VEEYRDALTSITLRRGPCFGACPMYEVTLRADGTASWYGERFVPRLGRHRGEVSIDAYQKLARFIQRAGFLGWQDEYVANVPDTPDYVLTVTAGQRTKTVRQNATDEPPDFWVIATLIDALAATVDWTVAEAPAGVCRDWHAAHDHQPHGPAVLRVIGMCQFPTAGWSVELRRHEPQGMDPRELLLDRVVYEPQGPAAEVITDIEVRYEELTALEYETVTILPDGPSIPVHGVH